MPDDVFQAICGFLKNPGTAGEHRKLLLRRAATARTAGRHEQATEYEKYAALMSMSMREPDAAAPFFHHHGSRPAPADTAGDLEQRLLEAIDAAGDEPHPASRAAELAKHPEHPVVQKVIRHYLPDWRPDFTDEDRR